MSRLECYVIVIALALASGACASSGAIPQPFPSPARRTPTARLPAPNGSAGTTAVLGYSVTSTALNLRGTPYRDGGADAAGFDCSGFVQYVFAQHGVKVPRRVNDQYRAGKDVEPARLQPGDLVFFTTVAPGASHVGIALGGDEFVHAPSTTGEVRVERMSTAYWSTRFVGARRVL